MSESGKIYKIEVSKSAADFIRGQAPKIQRQIASRINSLAVNPRNAGEPIKNSDGIYKIRSGSYSIAYQIIDDRLIVLVVRVGHRSDFYRFYDNK
jgi:mRNA interferase RelE/StbE